MRGFEGNVIFLAKTIEAVPKTLVFGETGFACPATYENRRFATRSAKNNKKPVIK
jgi:hypothetical protein